MADLDRQRWNQKYRDKAIRSVPSPDNWLCEAVSTQPAGRALDLACGLGHNAIWLGQRGWQVDAIDVSDVALSLATEAATAADCSMVTWIEADLDNYVPAPATYDLIVVFRYLDRERLPVLIESALTPAGTLVYETFSQRQLARVDNNLKNDRFTLAPGELPRLFPNLIIDRFEEVDLPDRSVARLVAKKPCLGAPLERLD